jgi:biopolymer transport protein ExbB/TolQ
MKVPGISSYLSAAVLSAAILAAPLLHAQGMQKNSVPATENVVSEEKIENTANGQKLEAGNGDSLFVTFRQGGILMWPILLLGVLALMIIIERCIFYLRSRAWDSARLVTYLDEVASKSDASFREELEDELQGAVQVYMNRMEKGMGLLNGAGNLAPVIGFFGTVQGMIGAFAAIAAAATVNAKVVAVGIQIALITTAGGLSVAVPALAFFYFFTHIIQTLYAKSDEIIVLKSAHMPRYSQRETEKAGGN